MKPLSSRRMGYFGWLPKKGRLWQPGRPDQDPASRERRTVHGVGSRRGNPADHDRAYELRPVGGDMVSKAGAPLGPIVLKRVGEYFALRRIPPQPLKRASCSSCPSWWLLPSIFRVAWIPACAGCRVPRLACPAVPFGVGRFSAVEQASWLRRSGGHPAWLASTCPPTEAGWLCDFGRLYRF